MPIVVLVIVMRAGFCLSNRVDVVQIAKDKDAMRKFSRQTRDAARAVTRGLQSTTVIARSRVVPSSAVCTAGARYRHAASDAQFLDPHVSIGQSSRTRASTLRSVSMEAILAWRSSVVTNARRATGYQGHFDPDVDPPGAGGGKAQSRCQKIARLARCDARSSKRCGGALEHGLTESCRPAHNLAGLGPLTKTGPRAFANDAIRYGATNDQMPT